MNPQWFGDSYDIVKRFFAGHLRDMGYQVYIDPMFTGQWDGLEKQFYDFIGVIPLDYFIKSSEKTALLIDPDTGVGDKSKATHTTIETLLNHIEQHKIVFSYDQSFSRNRNLQIQRMHHKLNRLKNKGATGFYYNSHAPFLFTSKSPEILANLKQFLTEIGLPKNRIISS
jgi:hypothetical protein